MSIEKMLWAISMFGHNTQKGMVELRFENSKVQVSINDARKFAYSVLEAAEAAETDEFLIKWIRDVVGIKDQNARYKLLLEFRNFREARRREKS